MSQKQETRRANAKINLTLDLTGTLPDGYHAIYTVMQSIDLCDEVTLSLPADGDRARRGFAEGGIRLTCPDPSVPTDRRNTAFAAAEAFFAFLGEAPAVDIHIDKRIPAQAGLGGGSADAAAVLRGLNALYGEPVPEEKLLAIALAVGADVPFCLAGGTRLCLNKGEVMAKLAPFSANLVIAKPDAGVSTAAAFRRFDAAVALDHPRNDDFLFHFARQAYDDAFCCAGNLFEQLTDVPAGAAIKSSMRGSGAYYAAMSGSGSAYFGLFRSAQDAAAAAGRLRAFVPFVAVCKTAAAGTEAVPADSL